MPVSHVQNRWDTVIKKPRVIPHFKRCITVAFIATRNINRQGGGERKGGVAKQGTRPGQGGDKRADNVGKQAQRSRGGQEKDKRRTREGQEEDKRRTRGGQRRTRGGEKGKTMREGQRRTREGLKDDKGLLLLNGVALDRRPVLRALLPCWCGRCCILRALVGRWRWRWIGVLFCWRWCSCCLWIGVSFCGRCCPAGAGAKTSRHARDDKPIYAGVTFLERTPTVNCLGKIFDGDQLIFQRAMKGKGAKASLKVFPAPCPAMEVKENTSKEGRSPSSSNPKP